MPFLERRLASDRSQDSIVDKTNAKKTVGVIGAGNAGCALAYDLAHRGHKVILRGLAGHSGHIPKIKANDNLLECTGTLNGKLEIEVSEDFDRDVRFRERLVVVTVPSQAHDAVLTELSRHDLSSSIVVFITGNGVGPRARTTLNAKIICDTATSLYSSRVNSEGVVSIRGIKERYQIAALQADISPAERADVQSIFSAPLQWSDNLLEMFLSGVNGVVHVPTALMNMGWIESTGGAFYFYRQGMSESTCAVIAAADKERIAVASAYGLEVSPVLATYNTNYGRSDKTFREFAEKTEAHNRTQGAQKRFLSQDVPYWCVLCSDLGARAGVPTPFIDMMISLASTTSGIDYRATGRTLSSLGLSGASPADVLEAFRETPQRRTSLTMRLPIGPKLQMRKISFIVSRAIHV